jgi:hypothetical protein
MVVAFTSNHTSTVNGKCKVIVPIVAEDALMIAFDSGVNWGVLVLLTHVIHLSSLLS